MTFLILFFAHLLADFSFQGQFLATTKGQNLISLTAHSGIWTGTILSIAYFVGYKVTIYDVFIFFTVHALADYAKAKPLSFYKKLNPLGLGLVIDQTVHVLQLIMFMIQKS